VILTLIREEEMIKKPIPNADPRNWQPHTHGQDPDHMDTQGTQLIHKIRASFPTPGGIAPGWYKVGLWLPDPHKRLRKDPRYAVRLANRDIPWWRNTDNQYGVNILGITRIQN
jgi:hypothetical protein